MKNNVTLQGEGKLASTLSTTRDIKMNFQSGNVSDASIIDSSCMATTEKVAPMRFFVSFIGNA